MPNAIDASATLGNIITVPRTVTLDIPVTIGTLNLSGSNAYTVSGANALTFDVSAGTAALNVTGTASPQSPPESSSTTPLRLAKPPQAH